MIGILTIKNINLLTFLPQGNVYEAWIYVVRIGDGAAH
jgi:hypothetical protein